MGISELKKQVLEKIKPSKEEIGKEQEFAQGIIGKIREIEGNHIECVLAGSIARNTHLRNDRDIDIFVLFPQQLSREEFEKEGLKLGKEIFGKNPWEEAYTEHPYVRGLIEGYEVEIVPSYKVEKAEQLKSAVDRSPFHTAYLNKKLDDGMRDEIRMLRQFFKGIKCYGADLKFSSVPGYGVELLGLHYGNFENVLKAASEWKHGNVIDIENQLPIEDAKAKFKEPLVVIDPVDRNRNVAAALSLTQFARFVAAARQFLRKPSPAFFFGKTFKPWRAAQLKKILGKKQVVVLEFSYPKGVIADIIWGQLRKVTRKFATQLQLNEFTVLRSAEWTDEKESCVIVFEFASEELTKVSKRIGPPVSEVKGSENFLKAHKKVVSGPRVEEGRWIIETERKFWKAEDFIKEYIQKLKKEEKPEVRKAISKRFRILEDKNIVKYYQKHKGFQEFLTGYLKGKEEFLEY